jgi:hypothetical protein
MAASEESLALLRSIDASLKQLLAFHRVAQPKPVASDRDLDGPHGDPVVKFLPRDWNGDQRFKGLRMSECPAQLLELLAETFDYFGDKAERENEQTNAGKPVAPYKRADAARARGWAKRVRDGRVMAAVTSAPQWGEPDGNKMDEGSPWASDGF